MTILFFFLVLFGNIWLWKIFSINIFLAILLVGTSWLLYKSFKKERLYKLLIPLTLALLLFEYKNTNVMPLTYLTNQEKLNQRMQMDAYPPITAIPLAHWLEERKETLVIYKMTQNISDVLSPNLYFFANHPNERVGIKEFEKFPYLLFPFFVVGFLTLHYKKNKGAIFVSFFLPFLLVIFISGNTSLGPFIFFPIIAVLSSLGIERTYESFVILAHGRLFLILLLLAFALILTQNILYETF